MIRVLLADDHAVVRQGLRTFLDLQEDIEVVAEAGDGEVAVDAARRTDPDVILLDLVMPRLDGVGALQAPARHPRAGDRAHELRRRRQAVRGAARRRAAGYLLKDVEPAELVKAIRSAHGGNTPLSPHDRHPRRRGDRGRRRRAPRRSTTSPRASARCCVLIAKGRSNKVIALDARRGREDGQDARLPHPRQARPRPTAPRPRSSPSATAW